MKKLLIEKIESLPELPNSIIELEDFRKIETPNPEQLIEIIKQDPLMVTTILRIANSSMFGFRSKIDTLSRAINLLGINFTISIAIGTVVQDTIKSNLSAYGIDNDKFIELSALASKIINTWISSIDFDLKEELLLPAFLQETGKFIISDLIQGKDAVKDFQKALKTSSSISKCEEEFTGFTCSRITANIFRHWSLSHTLIFSIGFVEDLDNCPKNYVKHAQILEIVKTLCDLRDPLGFDAIEKATLKAKEYGFEVERLQNSIDVIKEEINLNS